MGGEIWDFAEDHAKRVQFADEVNELQNKIRKLGTTCGDCDYWMKSKLCPREKNVKGYSQGPSISEVLCKSFLESQATIELRKKWAAELKKLQSQ